MQHIFVVDDSITTLKLAERSLKNFYELTLLTSAKQLYAALNRRIPDLILLDIEMPEIDGMHALEEIRKFSEWDDIPVVFLTSHSEKETVMSGLERGALDYIIKPFDSLTLPDRIRRCLKGTQK